MQRKISSLAATLAASLLLLTGCGAGPNAPTRLINQVTDGVEKKVGDIKLLHMLLVRQSDGSAVLVGTAVNDGDAPDLITNMVANGVPAQVSPAALVIAPDAPLIFSGDSANAFAIFPGLNVAAGSHVTLDITLNGAGSEKLELLVREKVGEFANVGVTPPTN